MNTSTTGGNSNVPSNIDDAKIKDILRRLNDLDKNVKLIMSQINIDAINKEFARINEVLDNKANKQDILDIRDLLSKKINYFLSILTILSILSILSILKIKYNSTYYLSYLNFSYITLSYSSHLTKHHLK